MRTRLSVCRRKRRFATVTAALAAVAGDAVLLPYRCDRCAQVHLTSRTKGKRERRISPAEPLLRHCSGARTGIGERSNVCLSGP